MTPLQNHIEALRQEAIDANPLRVIEFLIRVKKVGTMTLSGYLIDIEEMLEYLTTNNIPVLRVLDRSQFRFGYGSQTWQEQIRDKANGQSRED